MTIRLVISRVFLLAVLAFLPVSVAAQQLEIHYINVGWGGSVLVKGPNGTTVLLEAGETNRGTTRVVPYLQAIGMTPSGGLDYTFVGHQHCDHVGGLDEVIQAGYDVRIKNYYNGSSNPSPCVPGWNTAAATTTAGAPEAVPVGTQIQLGNGARLTVVARNGSIIGGGSVAVTNENDRSIAVLIQYGGFDYLWASDMGGGNIDQACTGRSTTQVDVESFVIQAISPGGDSPLISAGGIDVLNVNHHGSESSTNKNWMNLSHPALAVISTGDGQGGTFHLPRIDVVEKVLLAQATACISVPPALVLQTEDGAPVGSKTSSAGFSVGNIKITTDGVSTFTVSADGSVAQGANEVAAAGLPKTIALDDTVPTNTTPPVISNVQVDDITTSGALITWTTDEPADALIEYGPTTSYGNSVSDPTDANSHSIVLTGLSGNTLYHYRVKSTDAMGNTTTSVDHSFRTGGSTNYGPSATSILMGTFAAGSFTSLATNNQSYYQVNSTASGTPRVSDWYASVVITETPSLVSQLITTFNGDYTRNNTTQRLYLFNWSTATWTQIDTRTVGESDVTVTHTQIAPANFISPSGEIRLRVRGRRSSSQSFIGRGDFVRFTVETTGASIN
jgi:beta-lactamase superfamily II metal-dependent hydrolase